MMNKSMHSLILVLALTLALIISTVRGAADDETGKQRRQLSVPGGGGGGSALRGASVDLDELRQNVAAAASPHVGPPLEEQQQENPGESLDEFRQSVAAAASPPIGPALEQQQQSPFGPWPDLVSGGLNLMRMIGKLGQTRCACSCEDPVGRDPNSEPRAVAKPASVDEEIEAAEIEEAAAATTNAAEETKSFNIPRPSGEVAEQALEEMRSTGVLVQILPIPDLFPERSQICMRMSWAMVLVDLDPQNFACVQQC